MTAYRLAPLAFALLATAAHAQETYKVELVKAPPPDGIAAAIRAELADQAVRVRDGQGNVYAEIWLRKTVPASGKPAGPSGAVQFPVLGEGELIGALRYGGEGHDYRDQPIAKGLYTLRYGLQPVNGDHLGVSTFRDYALLVPAGKDKDLKDLPEQNLHERSADAAGTSHPAVLILLSAPESAVKGPPAAIRDEAKNTWSVPLPLKLEIKGSAQGAVLPVQLVVVGAAMA